LIQILSLAIFISGVYLFISKYYDKKTAIFVMILVSMIPATSRQWADQYRNFIAISFLPLFLYCSLGDDKKHIALAGVFLGLIGLTHRLIFIFSCVSFGLYTLIRFIQKDVSTFKKSLVIFLLAGIICSPFLLMSLIPSAGTQMSVLFKWEETQFNIKYSANMTSYTVILGIISAILVLENPDERKKQSLLLLSFFIFGFFLMMGFFGTPFLIYERYLLVFSLVAVLFSAPFISGLIKSFYDKREYVYIVLIFMTFLVFISGVNFINKLTPFIQEEEFVAFQWMKENIPENSTLLIPSRDHYWADALSGMNVVPLEWYSLLGTQPQTNETLIITGSLEQTKVATQILKEKYNSSEIYVFFTLVADPIIPSDYFSQQVLLQKLNTWEKIQQWGNNSYLFKI
jgi:hypothetical protein